MSGIEIRLLGPVEVERDGIPIRLGGPKRRAAVALLAVRPGTVVSADRMVDALWGSNPPRTAGTALQGHISQLRRLLDAETIATRPPGYALGLPPEAVDASRFERLVAEARALPAQEQAEPLRAALALWRGQALADVAALAEPLHEEADRLDELRLATREQLYEAELALGRHVELVAELEAFVRAEPLRERAVGQLMLALYRSGRQTDALAAYRRLRVDIHETLGLEPEQALRELERRILAHDHALAPPTAERRPVTERRLPLTAAAVGLDVDAGGAELDAEAYAHVTAPAREAVRLAFVRHGGLVERAGSAVVGLFGVPRPHEDDAARAIAAAETALAAIEELAAERESGARIRARAGIASGESFRGESAAVEQALRLQAQAEPGRFDLDEETRLRARPRVLRFDRPLAGRATERRRLRKLYDHALRDGQSGLAAIVGPAGIGKSRLAEDLAAAVAPPAGVLRARCPAYGDGIGLAPAAELIRAAGGVTPDTTPKAARAALEGLLGGDARAPAATDQLLGVLGLAEETADLEVGWAVRRLLEAAAGRKPVLVLVEDLHWARPAFLQILEQLAEPVEAPLFVVATARDDAAERVPVPEIELAPLSPDACSEIVGSLLGGEVDPRSVQVLADRSGGNPLFLEELVLDLRASGRLHLNGRWSLGDPGATPPATIQSLLAARLERLPEAERELLALASVLGRSFTLAALVDLAGDADEALAALVAERLLQPTTDSDELEFRHALVRDAAYASLPLAHKAELHERVAARFDASGDAGPPEREALAVYHLDQAYRARSTLAPGDARLASATTELSARSASLAHALLSRGNPAAASDLLARAVELAEGDPLLKVELGRARFDAGDLAGADEAFAAATDGPHADRARVGRLEVRLHTDPDCGLDATATEIAELLTSLRRSDDAVGTAEALLAAAYVSVIRGRIVELDETLGEALALAHRLGRSRAEAEILFLTCAASWYGPLPVPEGIQRCERILAETRDRPIVEAAALQSLAVLRAMLGDAPRARELVASAASIRREIGQAVGAAATAIDVGIVELLAGEPGAAEEALRNGYAELERLGEKGYFSTLAGLLAEAVEAQGRYEEARELARESASAAGDADAASQVGWRVTEARCLARTGDAEAARRVAEEAVAIADATDFVLLRADAWAALADVAADVAEAAAARATAVSLLERKELAPAAVAAWARVGPATQPARPRRARASSR